jgi:DNA polymerase III subunit epsilon
MDRSDRGFAVVDLETTGVYAGRDRIVEIGVVLLDVEGEVVGEWATLVNPVRDVGATQVHGLRARDLLDAPTFPEVAAELAGLLRGRVMAAHNLPFDSRFLVAEYSAMGVPQLPLDHSYGVCTMRLARDYLPSSPRALAECCAAAGWRHENAHAALDDARAAARLLTVYLDLVEGDEPWLDLVDQAPTWLWPVIPVIPDSRPVRNRRDLHDLRESQARGAGPDHFLARIVPALPRVPDPVMADPYLSVLDDALADRRIDRDEADGLVALSEDLALDRRTVTELHRRYLVSLARAAWEDGQVTEREREDLFEVAALLGLPRDTVEDAVEAGRIFAGPPDVPAGSLRLSPGDKICFTGEMSRPREELRSLAEDVGLIVTGSVSRKTTVLVCGDADSQSGKARRAREVGITVISEPKFHQLVSALR